jgi:hypothetical protein
MIEREIESPIPIPWRLVVKSGVKMRSKSSGATPCPGVRHRYHHPAGGVDLGRHAERPGPVRRRHRFDRIRGQVQKHLLELYAIPVHPMAENRRARLEPETRCRSSSSSDHGENTPNDLVDVERARARTSLLEHCANAGDDGSRTMTIGNDMGERVLRLLEIGSGTSEPAESGVGIGNHR